MSDYAGVNTDDTPLNPPSVFEDQSLLAPGTKPQDFFDIIKDALDPDERKFFKRRLGTDSYELMDWISPTGRFDRARKDREAIQNKVAEVGLHTFLSPTQAQAQAQVPGFGLDPQSLKPNPAPPMQVPKALMPDDTGAWNPGAGTFDLGRMQHPGAGVMGEPLPLPPVMTPDRLNIASPPFSPEEPSYLTPKEVPGTPLTPSRYTDPSAGTRPYQPQPFVPDMQARLTPAQQDVWKAEMHQRSVRQPVPPQINDATIKLHYGKRYEALGAGAPESWPGEKTYLRELLNLDAKGVAPGSMEARKLEAETKTAESAARVADKKHDEEIEAIRQRASHDRENAKSISEQLAGILRQREADTNLKIAQAGRVGLIADMSQVANNLKEAKNILMMYTLGDAKDSLSRETSNLLMKRFLQLTDPTLTITPRAPGFVEGLLPPILGGETEGKGVDVTEKPPVTGELPATAPSPSRGGLRPNVTPTLPQAPPEIPKNEAKAALDELFRKAKEGELVISPLTGKKYRKHGTRLDETKE